MLELNQMSKDNKKSDSGWVFEVAELARIELSDTEKSRFADQLGAVLDNFELLQKVDTVDVEPTAQVTGLTNVFRSDEVQNSSGETLRNELLSNAPEVENGSIKVPGVFGNN